MNDTIFNTTAMLNSINPNCYSDYFTIVLGGLLFFSEGLPFYKSNCKNDIVDIEGDGGIVKQPSTLQTSNGLLDIVFSLFKKFNK